MRNIDQIRKIYTRKGEINKGGFFFGLQNQHNRQILQVINALSYISDCLSQTLCWHLSCSLFAIEIGFGAMKMV